MIYDPAEEIDDLLAAGLQPAAEIQVNDPGRDAAIAQLGSD